MGQFGIITAARLSLIPAPPRAHYHPALYGDADTFYTTLTRLVSESAADWIQGLALGNDPQSIAGHLGPDGAAFTAPPEPARECIASRRSTWSMRPST